MIVWCEGVTGLGVFGLDGVWLGVSGPGMCGLKRCGLGVELSGLGDCLV